MNILIERTYFANGTNGDLHVDGKPRCHSIELPWHNNVAGTSCIPEGTYNLQKHISQHLGNCLEVMDVPGRSAILVHPANNALLELRGCIAPVTTLTGPGMGDNSKVQVNALVHEAYATLERGEDVVLVVRKK
ncbi:DUF5675 family protein [Parasediminibacterium sp. JCM 36343]|uniref:DUF5675 family protein n=1 Tax=Parasediminibacterium sp. JCM 36343 TaxID=3374279 RepID=UPI00397DCA0D